MSNTFRDVWMGLSTLIAVTALVLVAVLAPELKTAQRKISALKAADARISSKQIVGLEANQHLVCFVQDVGLVLQQASLATQKPHAGTTAKDIAELLDMQHQATNYVQLESSLTKAFCPTN